MPKHKACSNSLLYKKWRNHNSVVAIFPLPGQNSAKVATKDRETPPNIATKAWAGHIFADFVAHLSIVLKGGNIYIYIFIDSSIR